VNREAANTSQSQQATEPEDPWPIKLLAAALVSLICGVGADVVLVFPYAFSSDPQRMWFAAFGIGALFAALAAGWVGTLIASDRTRSRLLVVVGISEVVATVLAVGGFLMLRRALLSSALLPVLPVLFLGLGMVIIVLAGSWTALRFRSPRRGLAPDIIATLGLLGLIAVVHVKTIVFAPLP
jgi:hypothetical protein